MCRSSRLSVFSALALLFVLPMPAALADSFESYLEQAYPADGPGATAVVVKDGEVLYRGARGMANLELEVPLAPEHVFRLASITKQFTAAAILLLAEDGKLAIDDEITKILPEYPTNGHRITVEHLLNHTSGIQSYTGIPGYMSGPEIRADLTTEELVDVFDDLVMDFAPGERWSYNNSGYVLLGAIIEAASGMSYAEFLKTRIFDPLGMKDSHYGGPQLVPRRVEGYTGPPGSYANAPFLSMTQPHAAGSLLSSVDDLVRWGGALFGGELLKPESYAGMIRKTVLTDGEEIDYGYGLGLSTFRGQPMIAHSGGIHGFATHALWLPEAEVYVAVLSNSPQNPVGPSRVAQQMAALAIGNPFPERQKISLAPEELAAYVGLYRIDEETTRRVILEGGQLFTQRTGSRRHEIFPFAKDAFFYEQTFSHLAFDRDDEGNVTTLRMYPDGSDEAEICERIEDAEEEPRETVAVSPELYDLWVGTYEIRPGFELEIRREDDRLISQATNQPAFELHPASLHRYFVREFAAEIEFEPGDDGRAKAVTLFQAGQEIRAERIE